MTTSPDFLADILRLALGSKLGKLLLLVVSSCIIILLYTYISTTIRFRQAISRAPSSDKKTSSHAEKGLPPPHVPYAIPFLGSALSFLDPIPGKFWRDIRATLPDDTKACTIYMGGRTLHIAMSGDIIPTLFKTRGLDRKMFTQMIVVDGFGLPLEAYKRSYAPLEEVDGLVTEGMTREERRELEKMETQHGQLKEFLLSSWAVQALSSRFAETLRESLRRWSEEMFTEDEEEIVLDLFPWLRKHMFHASTATFFGSDLLDQFPALEDDYFVLDAEILTMVYGIPKLLSPTVYKARDSISAKMTTWLERSCEKTKETGGPDMETDWDPHFGASLMKVRERCFVRRGLKVDERAKLSVGFMFGLNSNSIPAVGWLLLHVLSPTAPPNLYPRVMAELRKARSEDGRVDISTLPSLPLLNSLLHETLRFYMDALVTREVVEDTVIEGQFLAKGTAIMIPSILHHQDGDLWAKPALDGSTSSAFIEKPLNQFDAERFLVTDPVTGRQIFSTAGLTGKFFPFGGGDPICPGRVFAKHEALAAVAIVLLNYQFEHVAWLDKTGNVTDTFPTLGKSLNGSGIMPLAGDMRVKVRRMKL